jgi:hypothetical protein
MTKEQTLEAACRKYRTFLIGSKIVDGDITAVYEAMENNAIDFANWVIDENYFSIDPENGRLFFKIGSPTKYTSSELYQIYQQSQAAKTDTTN